MMQELFYSAFDMACIVDNLGLTTPEAMRIAHRMWKEDTAFLEPAYRQDYRKWALDIMYWSDYMYDKIALDEEFPAVKAACGDALDIEALQRDDFDSDLFFKKLRVQILYINERGFVRMKLRTLMAAYGYKRRSEEFIRFVKDRLLFYHIQTTLRGNICDVEKLVSLDNMITFRIV
ncbi:MAG: hypothetical protein IJS96_09775 [Schwartzia sp.]|nr:hypothetical protein [Schwartzia sp. (in: firmicutes)]